MPRSRSLPPHLELRGRRYYWRRRRPPAPLRQPDRNPSAFSCLCFSLRTDLLRDAKILARRLTEMSDLVFAASAETAMAIAPDMAETLLVELARFEIAAFERARAVADPRSLEAAEFELKREEALQDTLRRALFLGDREVARQPLRHVAGYLGLELDEIDPGWAALAYEATKVLLDVSQERLRRRQGRYDQPTVFFRRAMAEESAEQDRLPTRSAAATVAPAELALAHPAAATPPVDASGGDASRGAATQGSAGPAATGACRAPESSAEAPARRAPAANPQHLASTALTQPIIHPAGFDLPDDIDPFVAQQARIAARPPRINVDLALLSEAAKAALAKPRGITLPEALAVFFELRSHGYMKAFDRPQKRNLVRGTKWAAENKSNMRLAEAYWPEMLGHGPVEEIEFFAVDDALARLWDVPRDHNRYEKFHSRDGYIDLIERAEGLEARGEEEARVAAAAGATAEDLDKIRIEHRVKRLKVDTYLKHGRLLGAVGQMLWDMQLLDHNPFSICNWSNDEVRDFRKNQESHARIAWDDRIYNLFRTPIFQEELEDVGEPLFWMPLIARFQGLRMQEAAQLGPDDFGSDKGIAYMRVRNIEINGVKSEAGERLLPVHPSLIELGLLKLVDLRRRQKHIRLFPFLTRGKEKGTLSAKVLSGEWWKFARAISGAAKVT